VQEAQRANIGPSTSLHFALCHNGFELILGEMMSIFHVAVERLRALEAFRRLMANSTYPGRLRVYVLVPHHAMLCEHMLFPVIECDERAGWLCTFF
jgi:hypothetical protein